MSMGMNAFFMIQAIAMMAFYLVGGVLLIILMIKGIQALSTYTKKAKLEMMQLEKDSCIQVVPEVHTAPVANEEPTEDK